MLSVPRLGAAIAVGVVASALSIVVAAGPAFADTYVTSPSSGLPGTTFSMSGTSGCPPGVVDFLWDNTTVVGSGSVDTTGALSGTGAVPGSAPAGLHTITTVGCGKATATFTVVAPPPTTAPTVRVPATAAPPTAAPKVKVPTTAGPRPRAPVAYEVNGVQTTVAEVRGDLIALAKNHGLNIVKLKEEGDLTPVREVVASYLATLILDQVTAQELARRGVVPTKRQLVIGKRIDIRVYGKKAWNEFPARFRVRDIQRTARAIALASDEGFDLTKPREARRALIALVVDLAKHSTVKVAPRFGTWNSDLAVVVAPTQGSGPPS